MRKSHVVSWHIVWPFQQILAVIVITSSTEVHKINCVLLKANMSIGYQITKNEHRKTSPFLFFFIFVAVT